MTTLYTSDDGTIGFDATAVGATPSGWSSGTIAASDPIAGHVNTLQATAPVQTGFAAVADMSVYLAANLAPGIGGFLPGVMLRSDSGNNNCYTFTINSPNGSGQFLVQLYKKVGGGYAQIGGNYQSGPDFTSADTLAIRAQAQGDVISFRHWILGQTEPTSWQLSVTDSSVTAAGYAGIYSSNAGGTGNSSLGEFIVSTIATETISVATPGTATAGASLTITGTYTGTPAALDYQFDSAGWTAASGAAISAGAFSFAATAPAAGSHTVSVRDDAAQSVLGTSGSFSTVASAALAIGTLSASPAAGVVTLALSAALSGGSGAGYSYAVYRGTDPNFTEAAGSLLATVGSLPYTDSTGVAGTTYFYGVVGSDNAGHSVLAVPPGLGTTGISTPLYVAATPDVADLAIVFVGDSITYGVGVSNAGSVASPTAPYFCMAQIAQTPGLGAVYGVNTGISGTTTTDWAPGGNDYNNAVEASNSGSAASVLHAAHPAAQMVFSVMLGTNDSASTTTNNAPYSGSLTAGEFQAKLSAIVSQILGTDWPTAKIVLHAAPWYSPNTQNGADYQQAGLSALFSYRAAIAAVVASFAASHPGQVFAGDMQAFAYFAENYLAELQPDGSGPNGTFYLHPAGTAGSDGKIGTQSLGEMWATAIGAALAGSTAAVARGFRGTFERGLLG